MSCRLNAPTADQATHMTQSRVDQCISDTMQNFEQKCLAQHGLYATVTGATCSLTGIQQTCSSLRDNFTLQDAASLCQAKVNAEHNWWYSRMGPSSTTTSTITMSTTTTDTPVQDSMQMMTEPSTEQSPATDTQTS